MIYKHKGYKWFGNRGGRRFSETFKLLQTIIIPLIIFLLFLPSCSKQPLYPAPDIKEGRVVIDISMLKNGIPVFYSYSYNKKRINFFILKIDGRISSYLDACAECYPKKLGFGFDNGSIYCRSCNVKHPIDSIEMGFGSCYPIRVAGEEQQGKYFISLKTLQEKVNKF